MKLLATLFLAAAPISASADSFYVLVGYVCDPIRNHLLLTYDGAYNEDGQAMVANKSHTQWDPWTLVKAKDDDHIGSLVPVRSKCHLSDGTYEITLLPSPGNFNVQGRCGAWMTASAEVKKENRIVHKVERFENDCHDHETPITTRVRIRPGDLSPEIATVPWAEFYK